MTDIKKDVPQERTSSEFENKYPYLSITQKPLDIPEYIKGHRRSIFDVLPIGIRNFILIAAKQIDAPEEMLFISTLTAVGVAVGNAGKLQVKKGYTEKPILYACAIAESGAGKTPALSLPFAPIESRDELAYEQYEIALKRYNENKRKGSKRVDQTSTNIQPNISDEPEEEPQLSQTIVMDATYEALKPVMAHNNRSVCGYFDEMAGWLRGMNQYKGGKGNDKQQFLSLFNGGRVISNRVAERNRIKDAFFSIIGGIQNDLIDQVLSSESEADGMAARFLMIKPETSGIIRNYQDDDIEGYEYAINYYSKVIDILYDLPLQSLVTIHFSDSARTLYHSYDLAMKEKQRSHAYSNEWKAIFGKLRTYGARLCIVLHALHYADQMINYEKSGRTIDRPNFYELDANIVVSVWSVLIPYFEKEREEIYKEQELTYDQIIESKIRKLFESKKDITVEMPTGEKAIPLRIVLQAKPFGKGAGKNTVQAAIDYFTVTNTKIGFIVDSKPEKGKSIKYFVLKDSVDQEDD